MSQQESQTNGEESRAAKSHEILNARKERNFRRAIESIDKFSEWRQGSGSHVKGVFERGTPPNQERLTFPYAAHGGEVSPGVRRSWIKWLIAMGLILFILACGISSILGIIGG